MKSFLCTLLVCVGVGVPANAACPEGHVSCEEAARLNGAAAMTSVMTDTSAQIITICEEPPTS